MPKPIHVFVGRQELVGYTDLSLSRNKDDMTGEVKIGLFMDWVPTEPVMDEVTRGQEILVYIGGALAFTGVVERRRDASEPDRDNKGRFTSQKGSEGGSQSLSIGPDNYSVNLTCRGKTRFLVDSSHQSEDITLMNTTNKQIFLDLIAPWDIVLDWRATVEDVERLRLRDGARVFDELTRLGEMFGLYIYETRDGQLRVTDEPLTTAGEAIVLGTNILSFSTDQLGDVERSQIKVKGQRSPKEFWGESAIIDILQEQVDNATQVFSPITVQLYGDATPERIQKRIDYEANKRTSKSKKIEVEVFHVLQADGQPWDIGDIHYVEIPPAGVFGNFEITALTYTVDNSKTLKTKLTLSPSQVKSAAPSAAGGLLGGLEEAVSGVQEGLSRVSQFNVGNLVNSWAGPSLGGVVAQATSAVNDGLSEVESALDIPPLSLPAGFEGADT